MKDIRGWIALAIFCASCATIGLNRFLMKSLNPTVLVMLGISIVIVFILQNSRGKSDEDLKK